MKVHFFMTESQCSGLVTLVHFGLLCLVAQQVEHTTDNRSTEVRVLSGQPLWSSLLGEGTRLLTENEAGSNPVTTAKFKSYTRRSVIVMHGNDLRQRVNVAYSCSDCLMTWRQEIGH